jgi:hypothetical protein
VLARLSGVQQFVRERTDLAQSSMLLLLPLSLHQVPQAGARAGVARDRSSWLTGKRRNIRDVTRVYCREFASAANRPIPSGERSRTDSRARDPAAIALGNDTVALVVALPTRVHSYRQPIAALLLLEHSPATVTARLLRASGLSRVALELPHIVGLALNLKSEARSEHTWICSGIIA